MRSKQTPIRTIIPDPVYQSKLVSKFISGIMIDGKKTIASNHFYDALRIIKEKTHQDELEYFKEAVENVKPLIEVRSRRVGGASYQVPMPVRPDRGQSVAVRWLLNEANKRSNGSYHTFADKL